jgi:hypothetical protein
VLVVRLVLVVAVVVAVIEPQQGLLAVVDQRNRRLLFQLVLITL